MKARPADGGMNVAIAHCHVRWYVIQKPPVGAAFFSS